EHTGQPLDDGFGYPAAAEGDDGGAAGLGLDRDDPEVFLGGEYERLRPLHVVAHDFARLVAQEGDVRAGFGANLLELGARADNDEPAVRHPAERLNDQVHSLVGDHPGGGEVEILLDAARGKLFHVHRRVDRGRLAAVDLVHAAGNEVGVGD